MFGTGHLHELLDVIGHFRDTGELLFEFADDRGNVALAVDQATDQAALSLSLIMPSGYSSTWPFAPARTGSGSRGARLALDYGRNS